MPVSRVQIRNKCSDILSKWRNWIKTVVMIVYGTFILLLLPKLIIESFERKKKNDPVAFIGGFFAVLTIPISLVGILQHMIHYSRPPLQLHIIRSVIYGIYILFIGKRIRTIKLTFISGLSSFIIIV